MLTSSDRNPMRLKISLPGIVIATLLLAFPALASAIPWNDLPPQQQQALAPLAEEWASIPEKQQRNFIGIAKHYPKLTPLQQQRVHERLVRWSKLTPAQRQQARERYKSFNQLPPEKREAAKQTLREQHARKHHGIAASAVQPASPAKAGTP